MTKEMQEIEYNRARNLFESNDYEKILEARNIFSKLDDYKDSKKYLDEIIPIINNMEFELEEKKEEDYLRAIDLMKIKSAQRLDQAIKLFKNLEDYKDSKELYEKCIEQRNKISVKDKKNLDRFKLIGYLFAGIGVVAIVFIICAVIWQVVNGG